MQEVKQFTNNGNTIEYLIDYPEGYDSNKTYPVIIYLHGYGFVKADMEHLKEHCPIRRERIPSKMPFVIIAPLCKEHCWLFKFETMCAFFEYIRSMNGSDANRASPREQADAGYRRGELRDTGCLGQLYQNVLTGDDVKNDREVGNEAVQADMPQLRKIAYRLPQRGRRSETQMSAMRDGRSRQDSGQTPRAVRFLCAAGQRYRQLNTG